MLKIWQLLRNQGVFNHPQARAELPAGVIISATMAGNVYKAWHGYLNQAGKTAAWVKANPAAWKIISETWQRNEVS